MQLGSPERKENPQMSEIMTKMKTRIIIFSFCNSPGRAGRDSQSESSESDPDSQRFH